MRAANAVTGLFENVCLAPAHRLARFADLLRRSGMAAADHDALTLAQATAYSAVVALFPTLIVAAAVIGLMPSYLPFRSELAVFFSRVLPSNVVPVLEGYFTVTQKSQTASALLGSLVVGLFGAANVMSTLMEGFRRAHDLPLVPGSYWLRRGRALALVPLSLVPLAAASLLLVFGNAITGWLGRDLPGELKPSFALITLVLRWLVALAGSTGIIAVIYHLGTDLTLDMRSRLEPWVREPWNILRKGWTWRASLPGAALATGLWFVATLLFGVYVTRYANYTRVYGSLGAAIALMAWLYIVALCVLVGAEFNAQLGQPRRDPKSHALVSQIPTAARSRL